MKDLVIIVESPAKSKTISSYFDNKVTVLSSVGHIRDLATSGVDGLGVNVLDTFEPTYKVIKGKATLIKDLIKKTKGKEVLLATDPDREGEAIAWHLAQVLDLDIEEKNRIIFKEITKPAVLEAINQKRTIDKGLVNSQESRRILDRIIGFKLSKFLRNKIKSQSAGRVQSVALKLIVELEKEILAFVPETYYTIHAHFGDLRAEYIIPKDYKIKLEEANQILETSKNPFTIISIDEKESKRNAKPPFITSTLLQDAVNSLSMSSARTMQIASELYQGIDIEGELIGLITYMRTDSDRLSKEFVDPANKYIEEHFGKKYLGHYKTNKKDSQQDAHEAIRPTDLHLTPQRVEQYLSKDQFKLYKRIYERALGSLMAPAIFNLKKVKLDAGGNIYELDGSQQIFDGYLKVVTDKSKDKILPPYQVGDRLESDLVESIEKVTMPPARYNEASLIKDLESKGIGRPSTYATIIKTLKSRDYVTVEEKRFKPTEQGILTVDTLNTYFSDIMNTDYTSRMENELDMIAEGSVNGVELLKDFYQRFVPLLEKADQQLERIKPVISDKICPLCGKPLAIRKSKYGQFYGCTGFPKCKHIEPFEN
ncbi:DNA topoisomerase 1 [Acholeplasma oculi]|uniref:DNA topoisomerase 1 n=1 Tax=Acholeplasma oculi TaxID=35623 RepID=A0A061AHV6_9MOLU|nr:type I DNA topoisomerase [Acholeplasma oculi]CDR31171.1 DNA topoisomerase I [Acholeplasma oculi]SKC37713.1 DNA topoisomerase-1 [Acholeplasma oculi]SUT91036.1 DNA topoisomerase 1 [Acholeplasma oculi]